ncbi:MAG: sigma 54-interacting transcriptional regulator [Terrisporobacter sp.]
MKKSLIIVTGSESTRDSLHAQLNEYIPKEIEITSYSLELINISHLECDILLVSSNDALVHLSYKNITYNSNHLIIAKRTINFDNIDLIVPIPSNTDVLLVNDTKSSTHEAIGVLRNLGIDYLNYIPYYPGLNGVFDKVSIAITIGELDKVPPFVDKIYNLGTRIIDFQTIAEILSCAGILISNAESFSNKYLQKIINVAKRLTVSSNENAKLVKHLGIALDGLNEGILVFNSSDKNISVLNGNLRSILGLSHSNFVNKNVYSIITNNEILDFIFGNFKENEKIININNNEILISKFYEFQNDSIVVTFKSIKETILANEKMIKELRNKGFYAKYIFDDIVGESQEIIKVKNTLKKLSHSNLTILLDGESGSGKELFASAIHNESDRKNGPFLAINFSSLNDELIESELFGYEEGSFTGARKGGKQGFFELSKGGTIFLDEIGDISLKMQSRLLRVLQEKEIIKIGGHEIKPIDVRIIAATNKNLFEMVKKNEFRKDLFYRLKMGYVKIPPLRDRKSDLALLIHTFVNKESNYTYSITTESIHELCKYNWHGNIRELQNTISYMIAMSNSNVLTLEDVPERDFFQGSFEDDLAYTFMEFVDESRDQLNDLQIKILILIYKYNLNRNIIGRKILLQSLGSHYNLSEYAIRKNLSYLETLNYISTSKGKVGIVLTELGRKYLTSNSLT